MIKVLAADTKGSQIRFPWRQYRSSAASWGFEGLWLKKDRRPKRPLKVATCLPSCPGTSFLQTSKPAYEIKLEGAGKKKVPSKSSANSESQQERSWEFALGAAHTGLCGLGCWLRFSY